MKLINFTYFDIDLSDIWAYAQECYNHEENNFSYYDELYFYLQPLYLKENHQPYLTPKSVEKGECGQDYYDKHYLVRLPKRDRGFLLTIFELHGYIYNMLASCPIKRENTNPLDYQRLFSLKLSQYKDGLIYLKDFLRYHLAITFKSDQKEYFEFIKLTLLQWSDFLDKNVIDQVNEIIPSEDSLQKWKDSDFSSDPYQKNLTLKSLLDESNNPENAEGTIENKIDIQKEVGHKETLSLTKDFPEEAPPGYQNIEGALNKEEILFFFSFLFKQKSENDKPFLPEESVIDIFKYGIAIPPPDSGINRYKLNISNRYPKSIIEYAMHKFYIIHKKARMKKVEVLPFFCHYLEDFAYALESKQKLNSFISNVTGGKPKNMKFEIEPYIPERLR